MSCVLVSASLLVPSIVSAQTSDLRRLEWRAPKTRTDNTSLPSSEIGGYVIRHKHSSESEYNEILVTSASIKQHDIELLRDGSYQFAMKTFDSDGLASEWSATTNYTYGAAPSKGSVRIAPTDTINKMAEVCKQSDSKCTVVVEMSIP